MESTSLPIPKDVRWRRLIGVALFLGLLYAFRKLAPVLICFVLFERSLGFLSEQLARRASIQRKAALGGVLGGIAVALGIGGFVGIRSLLPLVERVRTDGPGWVESMQHSRLLVMARDRLGVDASSISGAAKDYALQAFSYVTATAYVALFALVGFILAVMYLFERDEVDAWSDSVAPSSVLGTMVRWLGYVADAIAITVRLQVVVAVVAAVLTLPLLLLLGLPQVGLLFLLVLVGGMVPVVGGFVSGSVLCLVAYDARGWMGVGVFLATTFVLGKIESYYLSPRLTAEHVKLPGIVLVVSLLMFETIFGFYGFFLSFPALYVAGRIGNEWRAELEALRAGGHSLSVPPSAG